MNSIPIIHIIGLPGAGKTTLARRLSKVLKILILRIGYHRARFPQTPIGEALYRMVQGEAISKKEIASLTLVKLTAARNDDGVLLLANLLQIL